MKRIFLVFIALFMGIWYPDLSAQTGERNTKDSTAIPGSTSTTANLNNKPNSIKTGEDLVKEFTPYAPTEVAVIIPDVAFGEKGVADLISAIKKQASVKQASLYYKNRLAVITVTQKNPATFDFWNSIPTEIQTKFPVKIKAAKSMLLAFDPDQKNPKQNAGSAVTSMSATDQRNFQHRRTQPEQNNTSNNTATKSNNIPQTNKPANPANTNGISQKDENNATEETNG